MAEFVQALQAAQASQADYIAALPQWVQLWMNWMLIVLGIGSLGFSIFRVEARWLFLAFFTSIVATMALGMTIGWNGLWGGTHLLFWTPAVIYLWRRLPGIDTNSIYGIWYLLALATMIVALVFDAKDVAQYLMV